VNRMNKKNFIEVRSTGKHRVKKISAWLL